MLIKPQKLEHGDCCINCIATVAHYFNADFCMLYINALYFAYSPFQHSAYRRVQLFSDLNRSDIMEKFHGLIISKRDFNNRETLDEFIENETYKGYPVMIETDVHYCAWTPFYNYAYYPHLLLIIGKEQDCFICVDSFFTNQIMKIAMESIWIKENNCFAFRVSEEKVFNVHEAVKMLKTYVERYIYQIAEKDFLLFANELGEVDYKLKKENTKSILVNPIIRILKVGEDNRHNFMSLLYYLQDKCSVDFQKITVKILEECKLWNILRMLITKCFLKGKQPDRESYITELLINIYDKESEILCMLEEAIQHLV